MRLKFKLALLTGSIALLSFNLAMADAITKPNTFSAGTPAKAAEVNANFDTVYDQVNKLGTEITIDDVNSRVGIGTSTPKQKLSVSGTIESTNGGIKFPDGTTQETSAKFTGAPYRWNVFSTYSQNSGWYGQNNPNLFAGVPPSNWSDGGALASYISPNKELLRTFFTRKGYGGKNALVVAEEYAAYSSTNARMAAVLFRIKNTTAGTIAWPVNFHVTAYPAWGERASIAVNGADAWNCGNTNYYGASAAETHNLYIPPARTSTVIFISASGPPVPLSEVMIRSLFLAFGNNSLGLPAGLEYVDDLDVAAGGWEQ